MTKRELIEALEASELPDSVEVVLAVEAQTHWIDGVISEKERIFLCDDAEYWSEVW